jgi:hypothetical protein
MRTLVASPWSSGAEKGNGPEGIAPLGLGIRWMQWPLIWSFMTAAGSPIEPFS